MNTPKKSTQIIQGVFTGIGLWIFGHLLSGRLSFVEDIELYPTGPLIFAFPIVFAIACIYCKNDFIIKKLLCRRINVRKCLFCCCI